MIGGEGAIIEINEAKIEKLKYKRDRLIIGQWIFGDFKRETKKLFIEYI